MKNFALVGVSGYIAPRHMAAIKDTKNDLVAALDPNDSVGIIDSYFPNSSFFTEFERFDRHIHKVKRKGHSIEYISICSPNYLHDSQIRFALRAGSDVICEKPLVLNPWNIDGLKEIEEDTGKKVNTILQLRVHPTIIELRNKVRASNTDKKYEIDLTYITSRGKWYMRSWKGDVSKSGGIATNIGVHFFDMLHYIFGNLQENIIHKSTDRMAAGFLEYDHARVRWFLSIDFEDIPNNIKQKGQRTYRSITINGEELEFSDGFTDLHTRSYEEILSGKGFGLEENRVSIQTVSDIRNGIPLGLKGNYHPFLKK
tara:strand:+ start:2193 stop:3131 length:939 start_codon:yes stop_codon:yes gene_type:complete